MKKILSVLLAFLLLFSFTACVGEKSISQENGEESTEIPAPESTGKEEADFSQEGICT